MDNLGQQKAKKSLAVKKEDLFFEQRKKDVLSKKDKSSVGKLDKRIKGLCTTINKSIRYYTTSSCSGRVVIMLDKKQKEHGLFLNVYHDKITLKEIREALKKISKKRIIKFKQEQPILHVHCKTLEDAQKLLRLAQFSGWKNSGIISSGKRIILELSGTERLEFFIMNNGFLLVGNDFLELIIKRCNENLDSGWKKIQKLEKFCNKL